MTGPELAASTVIVPATAPGREPQVSYVRLIALATPILIPLLSQNLRLIVDTAMVGRLGTDWLAAQGLMGFLGVLLLSPCVALAGPIQARVARAVGQGVQDQVSSALRAGVAFALVGGGAYGVALWVLARTLIPAFAPPGSVVHLGLPYLEPVVLSAPFVALTSAFYGYWVARGRPRINLFVELAIQLTNGLCAFVLIFGLLGLPALGLQGAGLATAISSVLGAALYFLPRRDAPALDIARWSAAMRAQVSMLDMLWHNARLSLQNTLAFFGLYLLAQSMGRADLAAFTVLIRLATILVYPAQAIATAGATFAGQAIGAQRFDEASAWANAAIRLGIGTSAVLGAPLWIWPRTILRALTASEDLAQRAAPAVAILGATMAISSIAFVLIPLLVGTGAPARARKVNLITQWLVLLPAAALLGPVLGFGLVGMAVAMTAARILMVGLLWRQWRLWRQREFSDV